MRPPDILWRSSTISGESIAFIGPAGQPASARLLFTPIHIHAVTDATGEMVFAAGRDYALTPGGALTRPVGSRMPIATVEDWAGGGLTFARLVNVTYEHADRLDGWRPPLDPGSLPRTTALLTNGEPVTIVVLGDSISEGYDASGFHRVRPFQPGYTGLVVEGLRERSRSAVRLHNLAVAGSTAADGVWRTDAAIAAGPLAEEGPDLVIVAFGMNDACYADGGEFAANVGAILDRVRRTRPGVEFLLVSPMLPTSACTWVEPERFARYAEALRRMTGPGVALADVTWLWARLLERKDQFSLSGNGLNHPNDYGHRLYAQAVLDRIAADLLMPTS